jgi:hypothetical protein
MGKNWIKKYKDQEIKEKNIRAKSFEDSGLSKHLPTHFKKQYKQSIWRFQRQKFQTQISDC